MDYTFYSRQYKGRLNNADFDRLLPKATAQMRYYKRIYTVTGEQEAENMAVCAFVDILFDREKARQGAVSSVSVGSVTTSYAAPAETGEKAKNKKLYAALCLYMSVYRGIK